MEPHWVKSFFSFANGNCVEVAALPDGTIGVRDGKNPSGPVLAFAWTGWRQFVRDVKRGAGTGARGWQPPTFGAAVIDR